MTKRVRILTGPYKRCCGDVLSFTEFVVWVKLDGGYTCTFYRNNVEEIL